jgi:hypothetical protein
LPNNGEKILVAAGGGSNLQRLLERGEEPKERRATQDWRMSPHERGRRGNALSRGGTHPCDGGNPEIGQRDSGLLGGSCDRRGLGWITPGIPNRSLGPGRSGEQITRRRAVCEPALEVRAEGEDSLRKGRDSEPDLRNSAVRDYRGPPETWPWWKCEPASQAKERGW